MVICDTDICNGKPSTFVIYGKHYTFEAMSYQLGTLGFSIFLVISDPL